MSMQRKFSLMTVFRYISEDVLCKRGLVNPPSLATMLVPTFLEGARQGAGGQDSGQGADPPGGKAGSALAEIRFENATGCSTEALHSSQQIFSLKVFPKEFFKQYQCWSMLWSPFSFF